MEDRFSPVKQYFIKDLYVVEKFKKRRHKTILARAKAKARQAYARRKKNP